MIWNGRTNGNGVPKYGQFSVRRVVCEIVHGPLEARDLASVTCGNPKCMSEHHVIKSNRSQVSTISNAQPDVKAKKIASAIRSNRDKLGKLSMEKAREIRSSSETGVALAAKFNVSVHAISKVRTNRTWRDAENPFTGIFSGLLAANDTRKRA